ncbi:MAG TPA: hypothetical protein VHG30_09070 [Microvirga sp.]|nr:hypothetical protein [Microvirga sp.]
MRAPDLDGTGRWAPDALRQRYRQYCPFFRVPPRPLPTGDDWASRRGLIAPLINAVIEGMKAGDLACAEIGIGLIEEDGGFASGRILKANTARALRRCPLSESQARV